VSHQDHSWSDVDSASVVARHTLSQCLQQVVGKLEKCRTSADKQRRAVASMENSIGAAREQLDDEVEKLRQYFERCIDELRYRLLSKQNVFFVLLIPSPRFHRSHQHLVTPLA